MPELESTCDFGSIALFPNRSFTLEHRFGLQHSQVADSIYLNFLFIVALVVVLLLLLVVVVEMSFIANPCNTEASQDGIRRINGHQ